MDNENFLISRIDKMEKEISGLELRINTYAIEQAAASEKLNAALVTLGEIKATVLALQIKPAKRWEAIVSSAITAFISCSIGYFIAKMII